MTFILIFFFNLWGLPVKRAEQTAVRASRALHVSSAGSSGRGDRRRARTGQLPGGWRFQFRTVGDQSYRPESGSGYHAGGDPEISTSSGGQDVLSGCGKNLSPGSGSRGMAASHSGSGSAVLRGVPDHHRHSHHRILCSQLIWWWLSGSMVYGIKPSFPE